MPEPIPVEKVVPAKTNGAIPPIVAALNTSAVPEVAKPEVAEPADTDAPAKMSLKEASKSAAWRIKEKKRNRAIKQEAEQAKAALAQERAERESLSKKFEESERAREAARNKNYLLEDDDRAKNNIQEYLNKNTPEGKIEDVVKDNKALREEIAKIYKRIDDEKLAIQREREEAQRQASEGYARKIVLETAQHAINNPTKYPHLYSVWNKDELAANIMEAHRVLVAHDDSRSQEDILKGLDDHARALYAEQVERRRMAFLEEQQETAKPSPANNSPRAKGNPGHGPRVKAETSADVSRGKVLSRKEREEAEKARLRAALTRPR
jgi:hypothetical protein